MEAVTEEATMRTVPLDEANPDNILLEKLDLVDKELSTQGNLQKIDQVIQLRVPRWQTK